MNANWDVSLVITVLAVAQLALLIWAIAVWAKTDDSRLTLQPRWVWLLIILFASTIGPIAFLVAGRKARIINTEPSASQSGINDLYDS